MSAFKVAPDIYFDTIESPELGGVEGRNLDGFIVRIIDLQAKHCQRFQIHKLKYSIETRQSNRDLGL
jgi:cobyrinic acid a,c-diamide synthase